MKKPLKGNSDNLAHFIILRHVDIIGVTMQNLLDRVLWLKESACFMLIQDNICQSGLGLVREVLFRALQGYC